MMKSALTICELPPANLDAQFIICSSCPNCVLKFFPLLSSVLTQGGITPVNQRRLLPLLAAATVLLTTLAQAEPGSKVKHILLISVDGMHALDFSNCSQGIPSANGGEPYCPNLAKLAWHAVNYVSASTSKPSDSFPGLTALITGGTPHSTGTYYDVSYDRSLSPPIKDTAAGVVAGPCPGVIGTQVGFDESIDVDSSRLDGGGGIDPNFLPRDPKHGCAFVYPHNFLRVNTIFEVVKAAGGYTAWSTSIAPTTSYWVPAELAWTISSARKSLPIPCL